MPPSLDAMVVWTLSPPSGLLEGECFGDGSGIRTEFRRLRRCGWGLVTISPCNVYTAKLHGPLPGWQLDVPLVESFAFLVALRFAARRGQRAPHGRRGICAHSG